MIFQTIYTGLYYIFYLAASISPFPDLTIVSQAKSAITSKGQCRLGVGDYTYPIQGGTMDHCNPFLFFFFFWGGGEILKYL